MASEKSIIEPFIRASKIRKTIEGDFIAFAKTGIVWTDGYTIANICENEANTFKLCDFAGKIFKLSEFEKLDKAHYRAGEPVNDERANTVLRAAQKMLEATPECQMQIGNFTDFTRNILTLSALIKNYTRTRNVAIDTCCYKITKFQGIIRYEIEGDNTKLIVLQTTRVGD